MFSVVKHLTCKRKFSPRAVDQANRSFTAYSKILKLITQAPAHHTIIQSASTPHRQSVCLRQLR